MSLSVVITAYKRADQLAATLASVRTQTLQPDQIVVVEDGREDGPWTERVARDFGAEYYCRLNRPKVPFSDPAIPWNIGIRKAHGDIVILQCAECKYENELDIERLIRPVVDGDSVSTVPLVRAMDASGRFDQWYTHPDHPRELTPAVNFCQAVRRSDLLKIGGFDETYHGYGWDDADFELRLMASGVVLTFVPEVLVTHQWHPREDGYESINADPANEQRCLKLKASLESGGPIVANVGKDWGNINS